MLGNLSGRKQRHLSAASAAVDLPRETASELHLVRMLDPLPLNAYLRTRKRQKHPEDALGGTHFSRIDYIVTRKSCSGGRRCHLCRRRTRIGDLAGERLRHERVASTRTGTAPGTDLRRRSYRADASP